MAFRTLTKLLEASRGMASSEMETDPIPAVILDLATRRSGRPVTKRDADALEAAWPGLHVQIIKKYGGTEILWYAVKERYDRDRDEMVAVPGGQDLIDAGVPAGYKESRSIMLGRRETGVTWDPEFITSRNAWAYGAREERNRERREALQRIDQGALSDLARVIDELTLMAREYQGILDQQPEEVKRAAMDLLKESRDGFDSVFENIGART